MDADEERREHRIPENQNRWEMVEIRANLLCKTGGMGD